MGTALIMLEKDGERRYFEWTTITDAPNTYGMTLDELHDYIRERYGTEGLQGLPTRLERLHACGTSALFDTLDGLVRSNRCGEWNPGVYPGIEYVGERDEDGDPVEGYESGVSWTVDEIWDFYVTRHESEPPDDGPDGGGEDAPEECAA